MADKTLAETPGSKLFAPLTTAENWALRHKLSAGTTAMHANPDYEFFAEMAEVHTDLHIAWNKRFSAENPGS
jgi:hypothetical protein